MTDITKEEFQAWAYDDLLTNTTRGVLAEYIVARALGIDEVKRVEWHSHDLDVDVDGVKFGVEVKSAAYVQSWKQTRPSVIEFGIGPAKGWDAHTNTYATSAKRGASLSQVRTTSRNSCSNARRSSLSTEARTSRTR